MEQGVKSEWMTAEKIIRDEKIYIVYRINTTIIGSQYECDSMYVAEKFAKMRAADLNAEIYGNPAD